MENTFSKPPYDWGNISFILLEHVGSIVALWYFIYHPITPAAIKTFLWMYFACGTAITIGYHRYFSHKSFEFHWFWRPIAEFWLLFWAILSFQNRVLKWVFDHRFHHRYEDTPKDPYNIKQGKWWAHMEWTLRESPKRDYTDQVVADWASNYLVQLQHRYYVPVAIIGGFGIPLLIGYMAGDVWGCFFAGAFLKMVAQRHFTSLVNSAAHFKHWFSSQPYTNRGSSQDSPLISLGTFGEGYHNRHHAAPKDYRSTEKWYQFDPGKWLIYFFSKIGITRNLVRKNTTAPIPEVY